jgi:outer membrane protein assembly factor BamD (BamD/ComL family)
MVATTAKRKTDDSKQRSQAIKANVAVKDSFDAAQELYTQGVSQLAAKDYESAADTFGHSSAGFDEAYQAAADKRAKAEAAMKAADEATAESQRKAEEADPLLQSNSQ